MQVLPPRHLVRQPDGSYSGHAKSGHKLELKIVVEDGRDFHVLFVNENVYDGDWNRDDLVKYYELTLKD